MRPGDKGLMRPGDNDYSRIEHSPAIVKELTPELADKIWKSIEKRQYDAKVSKEMILHHLKQLKAQMGKLKKSYQGFGVIVLAVNECMNMVDKKIEKINSL